jgi:RNA polymerase sigma-70 factor (sigma-E family)
VRTVETISLGGAVAKRRQQRLADLYWSHSTDALRLAFLLTGDQHAAEDIVQDAFVRLFGRFNELRNRDAFEIYLRRTVVNLSRDRFRRMRVERDRVARATTPSSQIEPGSQLEDREQIRNALRNLPHRQRAALVLRFYVDLSEQQTAEVLECSVPAVKSLISRATGTLKERMRGDES